MSEINPYQTPAATLSDAENSNSGELASRSDRLLAALVDTLITILYVIPLMNLSGMWGYLRNGQEAPLGTQIVYYASAMMLYVMLHGYWLHRSGQSLGKKAMKIRIVQRDGRQASLQRIIFLRFLPVSLIASIPLVGVVLAIIDVLFIFRKDRRCLHDMLAKTHVVDC